MFYVFNALTGSIANVHTLYILGYMNTEVINIKVDLKTKKEAQRIAKEMGLSLSAVLHAFLRQFVRTKSIHFALGEAPIGSLLQTTTETVESGGK